jgi:hypothetical protein
MATNTIVIDKLAFVQNLETRGFTRDQAEGIADAVSDIALAHLVTKADLRDALSELKIDILKFMFGAMAAQTALIVALLQLLK